MCGGILVGALALFIGAKVFHCMRHRRAYWRHQYAYGGCGGGGGGGGYGGSCGGGGGEYEERHHHRGGRGGFGKRWALRWLFERLDTTPGQEKVIAQSFDAIRDAMRAAKEAFAASRSTIAGAVRGDEFGHDAVGEAWVSHDNALEKARLAIVTEMQKVHDALDERQRKILADLIESGPAPFRGWGRGFGPFGRRGGPGGPSGSDDGPDDYGTET